MKLLSISLARSMWFCHVFDLNPKGKSLFPALPIVVDLYKFKRFPNISTMPELTKGIVFEGGEFKNSEGNIIEVKFSVFSEGFVVDTVSSTKDSDDFLTELLNMLSKEFGLLKVEQSILKIHYLSQLYVNTHKSLTVINPKLNDIANYLSDTFSQSFEFGSFSLWPDQTTKINYPPFTFERATNVPFAEKRYFSSAGLQTERHLELLEKLENILSGS